MLKPGELNLVLVLLAVHWVPLLLAAGLWPLNDLRLSFRSLLTILMSIASWLIVLIGLLIFTHVRQTAAMAGTGAAWYLIYALLSFGLVPFVVIAAHILAGRLAGYLIRSVCLDRRAAA